MTERKSPSMVLIDHWADSLGESISALTDGCQTEEDIDNVLEAMDTGPGQEEIRQRIWNFSAVEQLLHPGNDPGARLDVSRKVLYQIGPQRARKAANPTSGGRFSAQELLGATRRYLPSTLAGACAAAVAMLALQWGDTPGREQPTADVQVMQQELQQALRQADRKGVVGAPAQQLAGPRSRTILDLMQPEQNQWPPQEAPGEAEELPASQQR